MSVRAVVTEELARINEENGSVTPEAVVAAAKPRNSPLHHLFEWDNKIAGDLYRQGQARTLIRVVREDVGDDKETGEPIYVRAYVPASKVGREEPGYLATRDVLLSPVSEAILLRQLKRDIARMRTKYSGLKTFGAIVRGELEQELAG